jgi:hypothetical protein
LSHSYSKVLIQHHIVPRGTDFLHVGIELGSNVFQCIILRTDEMRSISYAIVFLIFTCLSATSCKKDVNNLTDFRDKYIGRYQVTETIRCYGPIDPCSSQKDTIIIVRYGLTDSTLNVLGRDVFLDSTGRYNAYHYGLRLWNDSIYSFFMNGGLGAGQYETYEGIRMVKKNQVE